VRAVRHAFAKHLNAPAADLERAAIVRVLDRLAKDGKAAMASRTAAYGRACYQWAVKRGSLESNPFANLPLTPVAKRERVLTDADLAEVWKATDGPGPFDAIVGTLILTGQRREEVAAMAWEEIAADLSTWTVPASRAKNGATHLVPLSPQVQAILRAAPRVRGTDLVFPGGKSPGQPTNQAILGIDPGVNGGIAVLDAGGDLLSVVDMPSLRDGPAGRRNVNAPLLAEIVAKSHATQAFVEYVGARPGEGAVGGFAFGRSRGVIEGVLAALGVPIAFLTPPAWKRLVRIAPGNEGAKDAARSGANRRWPDNAGLFARARDDGRAEACLIAIAGIVREARK
jgi:crossover junction endodeoxyribonuclease RuvC